MVVYNVSLAADGPHYVYDCWHLRTRLFTVEGLRQSLRLEFVTHADGAVVELVMRNSHTERAYPDPGP